MVSSDGISGCRMNEFFSLQKGKLEGLEELFHSDHVTLPSSWYTATQRRCPGVHGFYSGKRAGGGYSASPPNISVLLQVSPGQKTN